MDGNKKAENRVESVERRELRSKRSLFHTSRFTLHVSLIVFFLFILEINSFAQVQMLGKPQSQASVDSSLSGINMEDFGQQTEGKIVWRENPFVQPANDIAVTDLVLTGIVYSEENSAAIVNNEIVSVGDRVGVSQVIAIEKERIILRNENGIFSLSIGGK